MNEENTTTTTNPERVPRPEDVIEELQERPEDVSPRPLTLTWCIVFIPTCVQ